MLFLVLQANYFEKISLILIFSLVNPNAPGLEAMSQIKTESGYWQAVKITCTKRSWLQAKSWI